MNVNSPDEGESEEGYAVPWEAAVGDGRTGERLAKRHTSRLALQREGRDCFPTTDIYGSVNLLYPLTPDCKISE